MPVGDDQEALHQNAQHTPIQGMVAISRCRELGPSTLDFIIYAQGCRGPIGLEAID